MKKLDALKLSLLATTMAGLGVGCASSGYARMDNDRDRGMDAGMGANIGGVGASASAEVGTDRDITTRDTTATASTYDGSQDLRSYDSSHSSTHYDRHYSHDTDRMDRQEGEARVTVTALSFTPETRANWVNKFPFWDQNWRMQTIDLYTFAVPDPDLLASTGNSDLPQFSVNLPPGSVFVESAGGAGEVRTGRVIQHSPMPSR